MFTANRQRGFTLLELLIAIGIFAIISVISYGTLSQVLEMQERLESERLYWRTLSLGLLRLEEDLGHAIPRAIRGVDGQSQPAFAGRPADSRALSPPSLEITRVGQWILATGGQTGIQRVDYRLKEGTLIRQVWPAPDRAPGMQPRSQSLITDIEIFELQFLSKKGDKYPKWPVERVSDTLPIGVEITLKRRDRKSIHRIFAVNG